jgi:hypothetical protein
MKKITFLLVLCSLLIVNCATTPKGSDELDIAIRDTSDYLNDNIPKGSKIVILNIQSDYAALSDYIIDELIANAVNDKVFSVVDRAQLETIRMELNFQISGEVDDDSAFSIGKFLGAQTIISGAISEIADRYRMRIRALNVQTAEVQGQYNRNITASQTITALMKGGKTTNANYAGRSGTVNSGTGGTTASNAQTTQTAQAAPAGPKNGTYTLWPRQRAQQAGLPVDFYIAQINVTGDYIVFSFARSAEGDFSNGLSGAWDKVGDISLQDLNNPSRFYTPVQFRDSYNGMGTTWSMSFNRFPSARFKITAKGRWPYDTATSFVWEEITLGEPDK